MLRSAAFLLGLYLVSIHLSTCGQANPLPARSDPHSKALLNNNNNPKLKASQPAAVAQKRFKRQLNEEEVELTGEDLEDLSLLTNALQRLNDLNEADSAMESLFDPSERHQLEDYEEPYEVVDKPDDPEDPLYDQLSDPDAYDSEGFERQRRAPRSHTSRGNSRNILVGPWVYSRNVAENKKEEEDAVEDAKREEWTSQDDLDFQERLEDNFGVVMV